MHDLTDDVVIYTDGSCLGNPGPGGWAATILENGQKGGSEAKRHKIVGGSRDTTNNKMEMQAVIEALKFLHKKHKANLTKLQIHFFIDSNLIVQTLNCGWKKKKNTDLWAEIERLSAWLNIKWDWIKAHHENNFNNEVDELAFKEASKQQKKI